MKEIEQTEQMFLRFVILSSDEDQQVGHEERPMLINLAHIVSIRPINIVTDSKLIPGFWIRTSNGKKYRAASIPPQLEVLFEAVDSAVVSKGKSSENSANKGNRAAH